MTAAKWGNGRGFFLPCFSQPIRSVRYITATHVISSKQARHSSAAQLVSLEFTDGTYESIYLVAFILVGPVYHNALTDCAALSCRACVDLITCVAERYLTLRTGYEKHGRKNPLPYSFSERSHIGNLRRIRKQGKGRSSKRKGNRRCPFLFALRRGRGESPRSAERNSPLRFSESPPPVRGEHACAVRVPRSAGAEKGCFPDRA